MTARRWSEMDDPENVQNKNAGNEGDLVKHTVYLATLRFLLTRQPWRDELRLRECHAGRGIYSIPDPDPRHRRRLLECLYSPSVSASGLLLHDAQRAVQTSLGCWPDRPGRLNWYAGSPLLNIWRLGTKRTGKRLAEFYEFEPSTRSKLQNSIEHLNVPHVESRVLGAEKNSTQPFDGEDYVQKNVSKWDSRDLIFLDPFCIWLKAEDESRRKHYRNIIESIIDLKRNAPSMILFWTWGREFNRADEDLAGTGKRVTNDGYQALRDLLCKADRPRPFLRVTWRWSGLLQFAMWVLVPTKHLARLKVELETQCAKLRDHLVERGCRNKPSKLHIQVECESES